MCSSRTRFRGLAVAVALRASVCVAALLICRESWSNGPLLSTNTPAPISLAPSQLGEPSLAAPSYLPAFAPGPSQLPDYGPGANCERPVYMGCPPPAAFESHSHFLRSLGRFGVAAPLTPGVESVHAPVVPVFRPPMAQPKIRRLPPVSCIPPHSPPETDCRANLSIYDQSDFSSDPFYDHLPYNSCAEQGIYGDKFQGPVQQPWIELGLPLYKNGEIPPPINLLGPTNPGQPKFYLYGDYPPLSPTTKWGPIVASWPTA